MSEREGFVPVPNAVLETMALSSMGIEERRVLDVVLRMTFGWKKIESEISLSFFSRATGLRRQACWRAVHKLRAKKVIAVETKRRGKTSQYRLNTKVEEWQGVNRSVYSPKCKPGRLQGVNPGVYTSVNRSVDSSYIYRQNRHSSTHRRSKNDFGSHELDKIREAQATNTEEPEETDEARLARFKAVLAKMQKDDKHRPTVQGMVRELEMKVKTQGAAS
ncbi:MAG: replication protein [Candidatus Omnitrophica bacterium]|nr:replication protein [Candidatus Omnitrophota bacterium]